MNRIRHRLLAIRNQYLLYTSDSRTKRVILDLNSFNLIKTIDEQRNEIWIELHNGEVYKLYKVAKYTTWGFEHLDDKHFLTFSEYVKL